MRRQFSFSKKKFLSLPYKQQHKKCAELIKEIASYPEKAALLSTYNHFCEWMDLSFSGIDFEKRFHEHLREAELCIAEYTFLPDVTNKDIPSSTPWLDIHIFLDGLRSCHNVGSIIRSIEAFRLGCVHFSSDMMEKDHQQIQKTAMGTWSLVTITHGTPLNTLPRPWVGIETVSDATPWNEFSYPKKCTLILGNEKRGISPNLLSICDTIVTIPLVGQKNSLNVANAFAIIAAQISWQQRR